MVKYEVTVKTMPERHAAKRPADRRRHNAMGYLLPAAQVSQYLPGREVIHILPRPPERRQRQSLT